MVARGFANELVGIAISPACEEGSKPGRYVRITGTGIFQFESSSSSYFKHSDTSILVEAAIYGSLEWHIVHSITFLYFAYYQTAKTALELKKFIALSAVYQSYVSHIIVLVNLIMYINITSCWTTEYVPWILDVTSNGLMCVHHWGVSVCGEGCSTKVVFVLYS